MIINISNNNTALIMGNTHKLMRPHSAHTYTHQKRKPHILVMCPNSAHTYIDAHTHTHIDRYRYNHTHTRIHTKLNVTYMDNRYMQ